MKAEKRFAIWSVIILSGILITAWATCAFGAEHPNAVKTLHASEIKMAMCQLPADQNSVYNGCFVYPTAATVPPTPPNMKVTVLLPNIIRRAVCVGGNSPGVNGAYLDCMVYTNASKELR